MLDEDHADAARAIRDYQELLAGQTDEVALLTRVKALEKLGVTEGTLAGG